MQNISTISNQDDVEQRVLVDLDMATPKVRGPFRQDESRSESLEQ